MDEERNGGFGTTEDGEEVEGTPEDVGPIVYRGDFSTMASIMAMAGEILSLTMQNADQTTSHTPQSLQEIADSTVEIIVRHPQLQQLFEDAYTVLTNNYNEENIADSQGLFGNPADKSKIQA